MSLTGQTWDWNGARWWSFDFHTHTPASQDYGKGPDQAAHQARTAREWLLDFMRGGIDCVAVTDHNTGAWIDLLKAALAELRAERAPKYRPLVLYPGVEISAHAGIHVLALFDPSSTTADIDGLLGAVGYRGTKGSCDGVSEATAAGVLDEIRAAGGIGIPAHVDRANGLFRVAKGTSLKQILEVSGGFAMEVVDPTAPRPSTYSEVKHPWTEVLGSDAHHPTGTARQSFPGSHWTWVKMGSPTLDGLRLALLDGALSVQRSDDSSRGTPNDHSTLAIESFEVSNARYLGRGDPLCLDLSPWLTTLIGGRGTGKSTLVELLRLALRRDKDLPPTLKDDLAKYQTVSRSRDDEGVLCAHTRLAVVYRKDGARFRIQWSPDGALEPIEEWDSNTEHWIASAGEIRSRFPVRIFSQKQIFQLAKAPGALLSVVDEAPEVGRRGWNEVWRVEEARYLSLRARARELAASLADEASLRAELADIERRMRVFESAGHADVLKAFNRSHRQQRDVDLWEAAWSEVGEGIRTLGEEVAADPLDASVFDDTSPAEAALRTLADATREDLARVQKALGELADSADQLVAAWKVKRSGTAWQAQVDAAFTAYEVLKKRLAADGAGDPAAYGELVQLRQTVTQRLKRLAETRSAVAQVRSDAAESLDRLRELRRDLTRRRAKFLASVLADNAYVRISVAPYGDLDSVASEFRDILARTNGQNAKDIGNVGGKGLLGRLSAGDADSPAREAAIKTLKRDVFKIRRGAADAPTVHDARFRTHLRKLGAEAMDRLAVWFPGDSLDVEYSPTSDGKKFRPIGDGSPGQRTAALLAFLLSYGDEPLILDQPEDDLDNHLIYQLIVAQLRQAKAQRQLIVVTHNPNIVVNGDAELVLALKPSKGQSRLEANGPLQDREVRRVICNVMEGGRIAFDRRYRRIALEAEHG
jgi:hypothetical protein